MKLAWASTEKTGVVLTELGGPLDYVGLNQFIPCDDKTNPESLLVSKWVAEGNTIDKYTPPEPSEIDKIKTRLAAVEAKVGI